MEYRCEVSEVSVNRSKLGDLWVEGIDEFDEFWGWNVLDVDAANGVTLNSACVTLV